MSAVKNRGLGKGLEALFNDMEIALTESKEGKDSDGSKIIYVDIHDIKPNSNQPRKNFDDEKIGELAESIAAHGIIQPIMVRKATTGYEIVAGERRWRAARKAGLKEIPCIIKELTEEQNILVALIENVQREDLNAIEEAEGIERMMNSFGLTQEQISKSIGKSRPYIANALRLLRLPEIIRQMVSEGVLSGGHARAIAGLKDPASQIEAAKKAAENGWSVREVETHVREKAGTKPDKKIKEKIKDPAINAIEEDLKEIFGTRINIVSGAKKGRIEILYYSRDELDRLLDLFQKLK